MDYATLKSHIASWLDRTDLTVMVPSFIALVELDIARQVRAPEMITPITGVPADFAPLPAAVVGIRSVSLPANNYQQVNVTVEAELDRRRSEGNSSGLPAWCAVIGRSLEFDVTPDAALPLLVRAYERPTPLSDANPTHALLDAHWDLYLYGALTHAAPYLADDARISVWAAGYARAVDGIMKSTNDLMLGAQINVPQGWGF